MGETDDCPGIRARVKAGHLPPSMPLAVDVTTGEGIAPTAVRHARKLSFDGATVDVMLCPTATALAEKLGTVPPRGITNARPRGLYDAHMLRRLRRDDSREEIPARR